jgi:hypothetical protein
MDLIGVLIKMRRNRLYGSLMAFLRGGRGL